MVAMPITPRSAVASRITGPHVVLVAVVAFLLAGCEQFIAPTDPGPLRYRDEIFTNVTETTGIVYGSAVTQPGDTIDLTVDIYEPTGDTVTERPLLILAHGGAFFAGTPQSAEIVDQARWFARRGYVTASISYRLSPNGCRTPNGECLRAITDARDDAQAAVAFLRANAATYGIDTGRIAMGGTSAGAITAVNVGWSNSDGADTAIRAAVSLSGASILTTPDPGDAPVLLFHGTADAIVPFAWAEDTLAAGEAAEVPTRLTFWEGDRHVPYIAHRTEILEQTRNFLYWHLNLGAAAR